MATKIIIVVLVKIVPIQDHDANNHIHNKCDSFMRRQPEPLGYSETESPTKPSMSCTGEASPAKNQGQLRAHVDACICA